MSFHTPSNAGTRWCPFARTISHGYNHNGDVIDSVANNRTSEGDPDVGARCIGPMCMAWRWQDQHTGYCGLAGRPTDPPKE